jgi:alpha-1,6-mannosyltransferase
LKFAAAAGGLGSVALVWATARRLGRSPVPPAIFVGLNPVLLVYAVGGAHNDMLMVLLVMCGVYLMVVGREAAAGLSIAGAAAVKLSSGLVAPFFVAGARLPSRVLLGLLVGVSALAAVALAVFGSHAFSFLGAIAAEQHNGSLHSVPRTAGELLGLGSHAAAVRAVARAGFAVAMIVLLMRTYRRADWLTQAGWATLALLASTTWLLPWYEVWLLPLAALSNSKALRWAALALGAFVLIMRAPLWLH